MIKWILSFFQSEYGFLRRRFNERLQTRHRIQPRPPATRRYFVSYLTVSRQSNEYRRVSARGRAGGFRGLRVPRHGFDRHDAHEAVSVAAEGVEQAADLFAIQGFTLDFSTQLPIDQEHWNTSRCMVKLPRRSVLGAVGANWSLLSWGAIESRNLGNYRYTPA